MVINELPIGFDKVRIANAITNTLDNEDDKEFTRNISSLSEIIRYIRAKYVFGVNIVDSTFDPIKKLKVPNSEEDCIRSVIIILPLLEQVMNAEFEVKITKVWLSIMEDKVVRHETKIWP